MTCRRRARRGGGARSARVGSRGSIAVRVRSSDTACRAGAAPTPPLVEPVRRPVCRLRRRRSPDTRGRPARRRPAPAPATDLTPIFEQTRIGRRPRSSSVAGSCRGPCTDRRATTDPRRTLGSGCREPDSIPARRACRLRPSRSPRRARRRTVPRPDHRPHRTCRGRSPASRGHVPPAAAAVTYRPHPGAYAAAAQALMPLSTKNGPAKASLLLILLSLLGGAAAHGG